MKAVVAAFNQEKALVGAFSVIMNLRMDLFEALVPPPRIQSTAGLYAYKYAATGHRAAAAAAAAGCS